ncbi:hypothetical protein [Variovorax sp. YR634]|uniref:hypothetical protein n=1 Tax=Variovorax sp. YR634 TaxID=1884385 RepID=UPI000B853BE5
MVRALLDGTKTQTRRVVKGLSDKMWIEATAADGFAVCYDSEPSCGTGTWEVTEHSQPITCPYGLPGDRLWVKETWRTAASLDGKSPSSIAMSCIDAGYRKPWAPLAYEADGHRNSEWRGFELNGEAEPGKTRVSIHMPRWASRIDLEVTSVRVERLQDISEEDARAEGISAHRKGGWHWEQPPAGIEGTNHFGFKTARDAYRALWEQINGAGSWAANPWVWVVEFRRIRP